MKRAIELGQESHRSCLSVDYRFSRYYYCFTGTLRVLRRAVPLFQQGQTATLALWINWLIEEILEQKIPPWQSRTNPRVVKKPRSKFKGKKRAHRSGTTQLQPLTFALAPLAA